jgi:hypothetical protein
MVGSADCGVPTLKGAPWELPPANRASLLQAVLLAGSILFSSSVGAADPNSNAAGGLPGTNIFADFKALAIFRHEIETLRGHRFKRAVPVLTVSLDDIQAMAKRDIDEEFPGQALPDYVEFESWLDLLPPNSDIKVLYSRFLVEQLAGMYDTETRSMYLPTSNSTTIAHALEKLGVEEGIVLAHEYTHALDHQYWPLDTLTSNLTKDASDHADAYTYVVEGAATRIMFEAIPAQAANSDPDEYIYAWRYVHHRALNAFLEHALLSSWNDVLVDMPDIPAAMARQQMLPYMYGYLFCEKIMRDWGLDGLDRVYDHPPVSTKQVMFPQAYWEWRAYPVRVALPPAIGDDWQQLVDDTLGAANTAVIFGSSLKTLRACENLVRGWQGDHAGLYKSPDGHRLLLWGSVWETAAAAEHFAKACLCLRKEAHQATIKNQSDTITKWIRPDGLAGLILRDDRRVILMETDKPSALTTNLARQVTFTSAPDAAIRAAQNNVLLRYNPLLSWQKDGDYVLTESLWGLLWRHDHTAIGAADRVLLGLAESRNTSSFNSWELGWGLLASHESETRRGLTQTALLPCGLLWNHFSATLPNNPADTVTRDASLWGLAGSYTRSTKTGDFRLLPFGVLCRYDRDPTTTSVHVLGTGMARTLATKNSDSKTCIRILGIPVFIKTGPPAPRQME